MLFSELKTIMVNKVNFAGFRGSIAQIAPPGIRAWVWSVYGSLFVQVHQWKDNSTVVVFVSLCLQHNDIKYENVELFGSGQGRSQDFSKGGAEVMEAKAL